MRDGNFAPTVNSADIVPVARNFGSRLATAPQPSPFSGNQRNADKIQYNGLDKGMDSQPILSPPRKSMRLEGDDSVRTIQSEVIHCTKIFFFDKYLPIIKCAIVPILFCRTRRKLVQKNLN
jgi:hypothetical protein